jgi:predicted GTPase
MNSVLQLLPYYLASRSLMNRWRLLILAVLVAAPTLFLLGYGSYHLWWSGWGVWAWWPMAACLSLAYLLGWYWQRKNRLLRVGTSVPMYWTERDRQAWQLVEARVKASVKLDGDKLSDVPFYVETAQAMALELAGFYHPGAQDPISSLTIPEMLAVVELAAHDLAEMVDQYLPGGHLLTVRDWRRARQVADWYQHASSLYWIISSLLSPVNTALRYAASQAGLSRPFQMLQQNLLLWFYNAFVHRLGTYLIELNSGRLRVGAERYRQLVQKHTAAETSSADPSESVRQITLTLFGQVKAGKSSLANALLGEQRARTHVLPATAEATRYELRIDGIATQMTLVDTVGYGHAGPKEDQVEGTKQAARESEVLLLVLHARNPARQADVDMLQALRTWYEKHPELRRPPIIAVLTHIDLLMPAMEWQPPYDWRSPQRVKEKQIAEAVATAREQLGDLPAAFAPVCTAEGKVYGVQEWLLPALMNLLDQAHAVALLRCLRAEADTGKVRRVFEQLLSAGKEAARVIWQSAR